MTFLMQVRCPECLKAIELSSDSTLRKIDCPACGSHFNLVGDETVIGEGKTNSVSETTARAIGHFTLNKEVGRGAFGTVWLARDQELDRDVAIKVPRRGQLTGDDAERFFREARASAQLQHANIVTVHEVGRDGDTIFVVSDFVHGVTLSDWLDSQQLTARKSAELCIKIADALHHAHEMGIVHRDLKPGNIMMNRNGEPHIMDFGLAKRDASEVTLTMEGQILGTPAYMSPEQAQGRGAVADRRADVYSLGVVLFQLLTGEVPFRGNVRMLIHQIINEEPPSPRKLNAKIPKDLETICLRCLQKNPSRRYQSATDASADLQRWLNRKPITARPIGPIERSLLWCRRNVAVSLLALLGVSLLIGIAGVTTTAYFRELGFRKNVQNALGRESVALGKAKLAQKDAKGAEKLAVIARDDAVEQERLTKLQLYVSDMYRAPQVWESGSIGMLRGLLQRHIPATGEPDNRGFEWHFWHQRSNEQVWHVDLKQMRRGSSNLDSKSNARKILPVVAKFNQPRLVFLNNGAEVALAQGSDAILHALDSQTGLFTRTIPYPTTASSKRRSANCKVSSVSYASGRTLITLVTADGEVELFDVQNGKLQASIKGMPLPITGSAFSDDGQLLAVCSKDGSVQVRNVTNGKQVSSFRVTPHKYGDNQSTFPWRVEFSPTGNLLAVGSKEYGKPVVIHDVKTGELQTQVNAASRHLSGVFTDRDDRLITIGDTIGDDGRVMLWDLNGPKLIRTMEGHGGSTRVISLSQDRKRVATAASDRIIHVWNSETLERLATLRGHETIIKSVEFSEDGKQLYSQSFLDSRSLGEVAKWDLSRKATASVVSTGNHPLRDLQVSLDGRRLAICTQSSAVIRTLDGNGHDVKFNQGTPLDAGAFSEDGSLFVSSGPRHLRLWKDAESMPRVITDIPHRARSIAISPDNQWVVAGGGFEYNDNKDAYLVFVDLKSDRQWKIPIPDGAIMKVQFVGPHEFLTASYGARGGLSKWNLENRKIEKTALVHAALALGVSLAQRVAAVVEGAGTVRLYRIDSLELIGTLPATGPGVVALEFLPDGRTLAVADFSNDVKLWNLQSRQLVGALSGHKTRITKLSSAKNPPRLYSGSSDGEVRVWHGGP